LCRIEEFEFNFEFGKPFTPYQQLMGVLPAESQEHVPAVYRVSLPGRLNWRSQQAYMTGSHD
jgi:5'-3' exonuclease